MRTVKYRAYDSRKNLMITPYEELKLCTINDSVCVSFVKSKESHNPYYDHFYPTELHEFVININGIDIYEKDIVSFKSIDGMKVDENFKAVGEVEEIHEIRWNSDLCCFNTPWNRYGTMLFIDKTTIKVIGNSCQNPDLVTVSNR